MTALELISDLDRVRELLAAAPDAAQLRPLGLGEIALGQGKARQLPEFVGRFLNGSQAVVVLLADCRPMATAGSEIKGALEQGLRTAGVAVRRVTVGDDEARVRADADTIDRAASSCRGAGVLVSVGSGSVADVGKAVSMRLGAIPHVIVQTAASVNGFADDQSVLLLDGVKRTSQTRWPELLVIDSDIVAKAPAALNRAGLGDLLATYTAPADWLLAKLVGQDGSYSETVVALTRMHVDAVLTDASGIGAGDPAAVERLAATLSLSGLSMGVAGRTAPGSGMEHTVSHLIEMAEHPGGQPPLHGAKVGILSVLAALLWRRIRISGVGTLRFPDASEMEARVHAAFRSDKVARECWSDLSKKLARWHAARGELETLADRWPAFDRDLDRLLARPEQLLAALREAGAPTRLSELGVDEATARWALGSCHLMRDRFTVADLAFLTGTWELSDVESLLDEAGRL